jgi:hypothetical protein
VVRAFVEPVMRMRASEEGEFYALLVARELAYRTADADRVLSDYFDPMAHAFIDALHDCFPATTRERAAWAYQFALGSLIHHMSDARVARLSRGANVPVDAAATPLLVRFITAGLAELLDEPPTRASTNKKTRSTQTTRRLT